MINEARLGVVVHPVAALHVPNAVAALCRGEVALSATIFAATGRMSIRWFRVARHSRRALMRVSNVPLHVGFACKKRPTLRTGMAFWDALYVAESGTSQPGLEV